MNTRQQSEELWQDLQPLTLRTPFLYLRHDDAGDLVFTDTPGPIRLRMDSDGNLVPSDDPAKVPATIARVAGPEIITYRTL